MTLFHTYKKRKSGYNYLRKKALAFTIRYIWTLTISVLTRGNLNIQYTNTKGIYITFIHTVIHTITVIYNEILTLSFVHRKTSCYLISTKILTIPTLSTRTLTIAITCSVRQTAYKFQLKNTLTVTVKFTVILSVNVILIGILT